MTDDTPAEFDDAKRFAELTRPGAGHARIGVEFDIPLTDECDLDAIREQLEAVATDIRAANRGCESRHWATTPSHHSESATGTAFTDD